LVCAWLALTAWLAPAAALGQTATDTILGEVKDATGGSMPGVTVTAVNQANGLTREAATDELATTGSRISCADVLTRWGVFGPGRFGVAGPSSVRRSARECRQPCR